MATLRKIIHVDMDAFFASVEQRDHPNLRGKPVVGGGSPNKRGAIATSAENAKDAEQGVIFSRTLFSVSAFSALAQTHPG